MTTTSTRVFISYGRREAGGHARSLVEALRNALGLDSVFFDVKSVNPGDEFPTTIRHELKRSDVVVALIGPTWVRQRWWQSLRHRTGGDRDWIRFELEYARGLGIPVVPVTVGGARMPALRVLPRSLRFLASLHGLSLRDDSWENDVSKLIDRLPLLRDKKTLLPAEVSSNPDGYIERAPYRWRESASRWIRASLPVLASAIVGGLVWQLRPAASVIETVAGAARLFEANNRSAQEVAFGNSFGVATGPDGHVYLSDRGNHAVARLEPDGRVRVLAGPDSAIANRPSQPMGLAVDNSGAVYFGEGTCRVRKLLPTGDLTTIAGSDACGTTPDGVPAIGARISNVHAVALDIDGSVVFSDWGNNQVRRIDGEGILRTVAGDGNAGDYGDGGSARSAALHHPSGLSFDASGTLFIADMHNGRIRKVTPDGRIATAVALPSEGHRAGRNDSCPTGVAVRGATVFVADPCRRYVYRWDGRGEAVIYGGRGIEGIEPQGRGRQAIAAAFEQWSLAVEPSGGLLISGSDYGHIYRIAPDGTFDVVAGSGQWGLPLDGTPAVTATFRTPHRLVVASDGAVVFSDDTAFRIYRVDSAGIVRRLAGLGHFGLDPVPEPSALEALVNSPAGVALRADGAVIIADTGNRRIREIGVDGRLRTILRPPGPSEESASLDWPGALEVPLEAPVGVTVEPTGTILVADREAHRVWALDAGKRVTLLAGNGSSGFGGDGRQAAQAYLNGPEAVAVSSGGEVFIADTNNHRIRRVSRGGVMTTFAGEGSPGFSGDGGPAIHAQLNKPCDLAVTLSALHILDCGNRRVRRVDFPSGRIMTTAGNGEATLAGDGGDPLQAALGTPRGLAVDAMGRLYLTDAGSGRIRRIRRK